MLYQWLCAATVISLVFILIGFIVAATLAVSPWFSALLVPLLFALAALMMKVQEELL
jgi:hypothetical protein